MPSASILRPRSAECIYLQLALPGKPPENAGVFLLDPETDQLHFRLRRDWREIAEEEDAEVLELLADDFAEKIRELGGRAFLEYLEANLSNVLQVSNRETVQVGSLEGRLNRLYRENVASKVMPFVTHLPQYSFRAAAGSFSPEQDVEAEDWIEVPGDLRIAADLFVGHVAGHSMEPKIPDGSLCVFRRNPQGSRKGKLLLIENYSLPEGGGRYTIKRYHSEKKQTEEGWEHTRIRLEPLNPDYESWELEEGQFRVLGEFVRVLPVEE